MENLANQKVRMQARKAGIPLWMLADALDISEPTMTRKLRRELPDSEQVRLLSVIEQLAADRQEVLK